MKIVFPDYYGGSIYNISQTVKASLDLKPSRRGVRHANFSGKPISLVVLDGLGYELAIATGEINDDTPSLTSVFPSITCTALTTLMSGQLPGEHSVLGDTTFLNHLGTIVMNSNYSSIYSTTLDSLTRFVRMRDAYHTNNIILEATLEGKSCAVVCPDQWRNKELATLTSSEAGDHFYYHDFDNAIELYQTATKRDYDFIYFYLPYIDQVAHKLGPRSNETIQTAKKILKLVKAASLGNRNKYMSIITADHGHIQIKESIRLNSNKHALNAMRMPPFGSARSIFLNSVTASKDEIEAQYDGLVAFKANSTNVTKMLGSTACLRKTSFNYIAAADSDRSFYYPTTIGNIDNLMISDHGGLTEQEMVVPCIVIE